MKIEKLSDNLWEIPRKGGMRVPGRLYANEKMLRDIISDKALDQLVNVAHLPGIEKYSIAMPDIHLGYGFPIGGVAAMDVEEGVISPGGVGYDINCGVRLMATALTEEDISSVKDDLVRELFRLVPCGAGTSGPVRLSRGDYGELMSGGVRWAVENGWGDPDDIDKTEDRGHMPVKDPGAVSEKALKRGRDQLGTLGSGNHFLEIDIVDEIYNPAVAEAFGLCGGQVCVLIHSGSRGFGHQICTDYIDRMIAYMREEGIELPDKQLACARISSDAGKDYLSAFSAAVNFAWANRQIIMQRAREAFYNIMDIGPGELQGRLVYDISHNIAKFEEHKLNGGTKKVCVHRKGATRAFPKGHHMIPDAYRNAGQPVLIPGDMGRGSYVLVGTETAMDESFGTCCHGAGRILSRRKAVKAGRGRNIFRELQDMGVSIAARGKRTVAEEMPEAYKDAAQVCNVVHDAGIARKVARLRPVGVIKG